MEKNYLKANFINLKFSIAIFSLFFISLGTNAQVVKEFQQRTSTYSSSKKIYNIKGDFTMIGNTNLSLWSYGNNTNNSNNYMIFVDEDNDDSTDNSSAAVLEFSNENGADPNCSNIVYAGLYWSGRTDNSSTTNDKRKIKVKGPNSNGYQTFTANQNDILYPGPSNMYAAYAEVTDLVRSNGTGEYWVADMALTQGNGGATGYYGGWGMIVIYENSQMNWRDVTIFDGYAHVEGNTVANYQLPVSGFNTAQSGPVNMKMGIMAGEGDVGIAGDYFQIKKNSNNSWLSLSHDQNSTNNFFNSSIENNGTNRTPNLSNNTGLDISMFNIPNQGNSVIANNQTSTTFRYGSTQDTYSIFSIAMSVDAYIPEIEGITSLTEINSNTAGNPPYSVEPGEEISYKIELKNKGTENIEDVKVVVPVPYNVDYVNNSLNTNFYFSPTPSTNNVYFDPTLGATGSIVWEISELPLATNTNDVLADLAVSFKVTENCTILSNACPGYDVITFNGNISGRGAITGTTFENKDLIRGYETEGACLGEPITSPFEISVDASSFRAENCGNSDEARRFIYCNREEPIKISEINSGFPSGTRFYNESPVDINSEEYTINNPIPNTTGSTEYYAIIPVAEDCAIPFTIEITSISTVPETEVITYCLNEEATPLDATASNSNYDLYYYTSETDTTPEMQVIPSTSQAGEFTYYVAEGESASCISPNKAEIKVKVLGIPEVAAPQNLNPDACGTVLIDKTIPEISSEFTLISNQLFEELGGSIPGDADIDAIEYRDEVVQSNPVIYNRVFKISYECGSFELTQQITLNDLRDSLNPEFTITQPTCENVAGKIEVISNNASSYSLDGENFQSSNIFTGLVPGNYVVYVQNETGCVSDASAQIEIEENLGTPGAPLAEVSQQPTCEDTTGTISVTTEAGISYTLLDENRDPLTKSIANGTFSGLSVGKYFVQASNGDCEVVSEVLEIEENLGTPNQSQANVSQQPSCDDTTGTISVSTEKGISYILLDENKNPLTNSIANGTFSGLSAGKYFIQASNGDCEAISEVLEIEENLGTPGAPLAEVSQQPTCEDTTGIISVTTEAGISYILLDENKNPLTNSITNGTFGGLSAGKYFIQASNGDCEAISEVLEIEKNLGTPGAPLAEVSQQPTCEDTTGTISVTTEAGISYTLLDENQDPLTNSIANATFSGLSTGNYFVQASNGDCEAVSEVLEIIENKGAPIAPVITSITNTSCSLNNGIIEFEVIEDLTFILKDSQQNEYSHENGSFTDLASGVYYLVAKNNDCEAKTEVTIDAINDDQAPEIAQLNDISVNTDKGICGAVVNFELPEATDNCGIESVLLTEGLEPGSEFPLGSTTVTYTATDNAGNTATSSFNVIVTDNEAPVITCIDNIVTNAAEGQDFAIADFNDATATDNCEVSVTQTAGQESGSEFSIGTHTITFEAEDEAGNVSECSFTITVNDSEAPSLECPENISQPNDADICGAKVSFETPTAFDNSGEVEVVQTGGLSSGSEFPIGISTIEFTATDAEGNTATCSFTIEITDDEAPEIAQLNDISVNTDEGICGAVINFELPEATDNCSIESVLLTEGLEPGSEFPVGSTTVTYTATDNAGNTATSSFKVIVTDNEAPVITCIDNIVTNAAEGKDFAIVDFNDATATDNCEVTVTQTAGPASGSEFPLGITTITFEAEDEAGNVSECSFTITVKDSEAPSLDCPENITQPNDAGICGAVVSFETPTGFDNSGEVEVVQTGGLPSGSEFPVGISTIEFTATDAEGNSATCSFTIEITDDEAPEITELNDISVNTDEGICGAMVSFEAPEATDNCGIESVLLTEGLEPGSEFPLGSTTVTYTATDNAGNTATSSFKVIITDNEAPVITCIDNIVTNAAEGKDFAIVDFNDATATDNCEVTLTQTAGQESGSEFSIGTHTITFEAEDEAGNISECSFTITVNDSEAPSLECPENILQPNDADICGALVSFVTPTAFDNSGEVQVVQTGGLPSGSEFPVGISTIEFTASDAEGNSATCSFTIEITDDEAPEIAELNDISVNTDEGLCGAMVRFEAPEATDNCSIESVILTEGLEPGSEFPLGSTTVTYTATDNAGNTATSSFKVIVTDNEAPVIAEVETINVSSDENTCGAMIEIITPSATDNCSVGMVNGTRDDSQPLDAEYPVGTTTITWILTDDNGNEAEPVIQTVIVTDNQAPVIANVEAVNTTADADACGAMIKITAPQANDNCSAGIVNGTRDDSQPLDAEYPVGNTTITWTVTDDNGNEAEPVIQTVTVNDNEIPVIANVEAINTTADADSCGAMIEITAPLASDNCSVGMVNGTRDDSQSLDAEYPVGITTITWTVTDDNGNQAVPVIQTVTVTDNQAPVIECPENMIFSTESGVAFATVNFENPLASDNCEVNVEQTGGFTSGSQFPIGTNTVTFTATDTSGNTTQCSFDIIIEDTEDPTLECPSDIISSTDSGICGAIVEFEIPEGFDNSGNVTVEQTKGLASGEEFPVGTTTITFTASDEAGNTASCSFEINVVDDEAPVIEDKNDITLNTDPDLCGAIVAYELPSATDDCGLESIELTEGLAPGFEFPVGETKVTYTAIDVNGNSVNSSFTVTVIDNEAPVIACPEDIQLNVEFGTETVVVNYATMSATDNCSETSIELIEGYASGAEFPVGETIVTYEVTDASGNSASCSFTVIVEEEPEETPPAPTAPEVDLIQPDCVTPTGVILINTEDGLTYSIDGENYLALEEFTELEPGTYQVTAKDEFDQISEATTVTLEEPIASEIETSTISLCIDDSTFDLFELLEGEYDTSGVWVDTEETGALAQGFIDPAMLAIGSYTFEYQLNNGICDSTTEVTVSINDDCVVLPCSLEDIRSSISKAVTPNGDNRNDYFTIDFASECGFTYDLMIFNRWGNKIYEATNYQNDWDGYSTNSATSSNQLPSGTYFYILEIRNSGFDPIQGYIYLGTK